MFDEDGFSVFGHHYRRVTDLEDSIGVGDIIRFDPPLDRDAEWYMFEYRPAHKVMVLVNWLGHKAGLENAIALVTADAFEPGTRFIKMRWFKDHWNSRFIGQSAFEDVHFYKFDPTAGN